MKETTNSNNIEGASLETDIKVGADERPFKVRVSTSSYNIGFDTFSSAGSYTPTTSASASPANFKMALPHEQMSSLYDDNSFPFHYRLFNEEIHLKMSKFNRDTKLNVAYANRDYYTANLTGAEQN